MESRRAVSDSGEAIDDHNLETAADKIDRAFPLANDLAHVEKAPGARRPSASSNRLEIEKRQCCVDYPLMAGKWTAQRMDG
jgi:hypothetical protein